MHRAARVAQPGRDVRRVDDRALLRRVHRLAASPRSTQFRERYPGRAARRDRPRHRARASRACAPPSAPTAPGRGMWGVHFIYGTLFGMRGLMAGGAPPHRPADPPRLRWLKRRQRPDGGWGEHFTERARGALRRARARPGRPDGVGADARCSKRAIPTSRRHRARPRTSSPTRSATTARWPKQDPEGIFFHTALLDYRLYRRYFPVVGAGPLPAPRRRARPRAPRAPRAPCPDRPTPNRSRRARAPADEESR